VAIKRFTPEGKFLGVVAVPTFETGCVRVTVDISPDGQRFYLLDTGSDAIHVFGLSKSGTTLSSLTE
jgi:sugar lactone lactonase YvrE